MPDGQVSPALDVAHCRSHFPALSSPLYPGLALLDNAGGSVTPSQVSERAQRYMADHMVQLGASYPLSASAQERVSEGVQAAATLVGAMPSEVVIGPSTTMNALVLSLALRPLWRAGDEVVVSELDHEANIGAFRHLEQTEIRVRTWPMHRETASLRLEELLPLLNPRTRLVAFTHCSNIVGRIHDVAGITSAVHDAGADVCVDGVAYAPHRLLDLHALGVDYYLLSLYKVFGPHLGLLFGKRDKLLLARGVNHYFIEEDAIPYKLQPGNVNHELTASLAGIVAYLEAVAGHHGIPKNLAVRDRLRGVFELFSAHEERLAARLLAYLRSRSDIRIIGPSESDRALRVPTIAFTIDRVHAAEVPLALDREGVCIRYGDFYAKRAIAALGLHDVGGIVRASMVHYNTLEEVDRLIVGLESIRAQ